MARCLQRRLTVIRRPVDLRAFVQQQPRRVDVALLAGDEQRRCAAAVRLIDIRSFVQQQLRRVDVALPAGNKQRRPTLLGCLVNIWAAVQPLPHDADVALLARIVQRHCRRASEATAHRGRDPDHKVDDVDEMTPKPQGLGRRHIGVDEKVIRKDPAYKFGPFFVVFRRSKLFPASPPL